MDRALAAFGRVYPDVPADADLIYAGGSVAVPAAGAGAFLAGVAPFGGASWMYKHVGEAPTAFRHRVLAIRSVLADYQETLGGAIALGAAATTPLATVLGIPGQGFAFDDLTIQGSGLVLVNSAAAQFALVGASGLRLGPGAMPAIPPGPWIVLNPTGAPIAGGAQMCRRPKVRRMDVRIDLVQRELASDGATVVRTLQPAGGTLCSQHPEPVDTIGHAAWQPVHGESGITFEGANRAFGVGIAHVVGGRVPASATVYAELAIARWRKPA